MQGLNTIVTALVAVSVMIYISPLLTLISLLPLPLLSFSVAFFGQRIHQGFEAVQAHFARISAMSQENLAGVRVVRAYAQEDHQIEKFSQLNREYVRKNSSLIKTFSVLYPAIGFLAQLGPVIVLLLGGLLVIEKKISLGSFVAFSTYLVMREIVSADLRRTLSHSGRRSGTATSDTGFLSVTGNGPIIAHGTPTKAPQGAAAQVLDGDVP